MKKLISHGMRLQRSLNFTKGHFEIWTIMFLRVSFVMEDLLSCLILIQKKYKDFKFCYELEKPFKSVATFSFKYNV